MLNLCTGRRRIPFVTQSELWMSSNFWTTPRRRSWTWQSTRLEVLATRAGLDDRELRDLLEREVQRRLRVRGGAWDRLDETLAKRENAR